MTKEQKLNLKIADVADAILVLAKEKCGTEDPLVAVAAMLMAAACLTRGIGEDFEKFHEGVTIAWRNSENSFAWRNSDES